MLMVATLMTIVVVGLLSIVDGMMAWVAVGMTGLVRDGFMAVFTTVVLEIEGVGATYVGTAMGLVMVFSGLGRLVAPPWATAWRILHRAYLSLSGQFWP